MKLYKELAISDTGFVFNPRTGDSFTLNGIALEILQLLKQGDEIAQIRQVILERYDVDPVTLEKNLDDFMAMLNYYELIDNEIRL